jgi:hypothetical protein
MSQFRIKETAHKKMMASENANYVFDKKTGKMITWGKTLQDDPELFPGPTIADIEITTICNGVGGKVCQHCYKSNNPSGKNMSLSTFKEVFESLPRTITQIAFGADADGKANPDIWSIMDYARDRGVIPNITMADIDESTADNLVKRCGAVAVSRYENKNICYDSVKRLTDRGMTQVNIHMLLSQETLERTLETITDIQSDDRLSKLNAIVFLSLKQKGRGTAYHSLTQEEFNRVVQACKDAEIGYGFDSCSSLKYFKSLDDSEYEKMKQFIMPCESTLESSYINYEGDFFPCSFTEGTDGWGEGIPVSGKDFVEEVWHHPKTESFREKLLESKRCNRFGCRECPLYDI